MNSTQLIKCFFVTECYQELIILLTFDLIICSPISLLYKSPKIICVTHMYLYFERNSDDLHIAF